MTPQLTDKYMVTIAERLTSAYARIAEAAHKAQRNSNDITLLAVSKTKPATDIMAAYEQGQRQFGESYVQEAVDKIAQLDTFSDIVWHFIGPIQSNKSALVAANFAWVQSVDRLKIAKRLNSQRPETMPPLNVLIQVNISEEPSKSGIMIDEVFSLAEVVDKCDKLTLRGLMAIPEKNADNTSYETMQHLFKRLQTQYPTVDTLSMGMSNDLDIAIKHGSTMVRIGTAIFGHRPG